ncbi:MAG: hypothetical protein II388_02500 [Clostridia bacterium]|nr:hypothetical protein [Clostridia bacterium]
MNNLNGCYFLILLYQAECKKSSKPYHNSPELKDYVYTPAGIRHDHPVYTFEYVSKEKQEAAKLFTEYCQNPESQELANKKGFNLHDDYVSQPNGLDGAGYLSAQKIWKKNKDGGQPIIAFLLQIFRAVCRVSLLTRLRNRCFLPHHTSAPIIT